MFIWIYLVGLLAVVESLPPRFENTFTQIYVGEFVEKGRSIYSVSVTNPNGNTYKCTMAVTIASGATPDGDEFSFARDTATSDYVLEVNAKQTVGIRANDLLAPDTYNCEITCTDDVTGEFSTLTVSVETVSSQKLDWGNNLPATITLDVAAVDAGTVITTKTAFVEIATDIVYTIVDIEPNVTLINGDPFFTIDSSTGKITALQNFDLIATQNTPSGTIKLSIQAAADGITNTQVLTIELTGQNSKPYTNDLPKTVNLPEDTSSDYTIFQLTIEDTGKSQIETASYPVTLDCVPSPEGNTMFEINSNTRIFSIVDGQSLNYEYTKFYNCCIYIDDGQHTSDCEYIEINVVNANDVCVFDTSTPYTATMTEGGKGSSSVDPGFKVTDEDSMNGVEPLTYAFDPANDSSRFAISSSGVITFNEAYELDGSDPYPSEVYLTVWAYDDGDGNGNNKLTCSAQVKITIVDANDNSPSICSSRTVYSDNTMTPGSTTIASLSPTDADSGVNAEVTCAKTSESGTAADYYSVNGAGDILLSKTLYGSLDPGATAQYKIVCTDRGSPAKASTCTVDVVYRYVDTTTVTSATTTTTEKSFFDYPAAIALTVLLGLLGLALLGLGLYFCLRFCCGGGSSAFCDCGGRCCERKYRPRQITPESPPPRQKTPVVVKRDYPPRIIQQPQQVQLVRTIARPNMGYTGLRTMGAMPYRTGIFPTSGIPPPAYIP